MYVGFIRRGCDANAGGDRVESASAGGEDPGVDILLTETSLLTIGIAIDDRHVALLRRAHEVHPTRSIVVELNDRGANGAKFLGPAIRVWLDPTGELPS